MATPPPAAHVFQLLRAAVAVCQITPGCEEVHVQYPSDIRKPYDETDGTLTDKKLGAAGFNRCGNHGSHIVVNCSVLQLGDRESLDTAAELSLVEESKRIKLALQEEQVEQRRQQDIFDASMSDPTDCSNWSSNLSTSMLRR